MHGLAAECFTQKTKNKYMLASDLFEGLRLARNMLNT
jgi:hypothetical protein